MTKTCSAIEFLRQYAEADFVSACLDVRSEGEFATGKLAGFTNAPILRNGERHLVGLAYKTMGTAEAVRLGHELVDPERPKRVQQWVATVDGSTPRRGFVICWRGGLRSTMACEWIREAGRDVTQVEGGYKAIRHELIAPFVESSTASSLYSQLRVVTGFTGSGKTRFFNQFKLNRPAASCQINWVDLEGHAQHRGSSFGRFTPLDVPSQATFENAIGLDLFRIGRRNGSEFWVEDESSRIGSVHIPTPMMEAMNRAPLLVLDTPLSQRVANIYQEYVVERLAAGIAPLKLRESLEKSTAVLQRRLGGAMTREVLKALGDAFDIEAKETKDSELARERHRVWIEKLLVHYYDPAYQYGFDRYGARPVLFRGDEEQCRQWILSRSSAF